MTTMSTPDVPSQYRATLHTWAARFVPDGATITGVIVAYDDGCDPTFTDGPESLSVAITYKPAGSSFTEEEGIEMEELTSVGELLTALFAIEDHERVEERQQ